MVLVMKVAGYGVGVSVESRCFGRVMFDVNDGTYIYMFTICPIFFNFHIYEGTTNSGIDMASLAKYEIS